MKIYLVYYYEVSSLTGDDYDLPFTELVLVSDSLQITQEYIKKKEEEKWSDNVSYYYSEQQMNRTITKGYE